MAVGEIGEENAGRKTVNFRGDGAESYARLALHAIYESLVVETGSRGARFCSEQILHLILSIACISCPVCAR